MQTAAFDLRHSALIFWLLAWLGVSCAYIASVLGGHVELCFPHVRGCESVSATGRYGWGYYLFKAAMLPAAGFLVVYWLVCYRWLIFLTGALTTIERVILSLGCVGAMFLVLYVIFLGSDGDVYRLMRRYGTVGYFGCTYLAQLLLSKRISALGVRHPVARFKIWLGLAMLIGGLTFAGVANLSEDRSAIQNISEWWFASALTFYPVLTWWLWRRTGFEGVSD